MSTMRRTVAIAALGTSLVFAARAHANDPATAQALFDQARKLMSEEKFAEACPKLEESQKLDPAGGTLLHLALCREREGRIATAWAHYQDALSQAKRDGRKDRAKIAQERIDVLGPRLPKMRVRVAPANRALPGFRLTRDDVPVGEAQWGESVPVDPGARVLRARAEGRKDWTAKVEIPTGPNEVTVDVPELQIDAQAAETPKDEKKVRFDDAPGGDGQRTLGLVVGGVGIAGLVVGGAFGLVSMSKNDEADAECKPPDHKLCTQKGLDAGEAATQAGNVSTIAFIAGGALALGGAVLWLTAPSGGTSVGVMPSAGPRGASLSFTGRF